MNRQKILLGATLVLAVCAVFYWIWSGWGLVTVDVNGKPLAEVIRSIEKQAGIVLKTNMDATKPVTMHVFKVPLTEALEALGGVTDSRWRLGYFFGPDAATVKGALETIASGKRPEGWKQYEVPLLGRPGGGEEAVPMDPRHDLWNVQEPAEKTLQAFMQAAAAGVSASFTCPEQYNPAVAKGPSSGEIRKLAPQLAKNAGAKFEEIFLLMGRPQGETADSGRDRDDDFGFGGGGPSRGSRGSFGDGRSRGGPPNFALMRERQLAEIAKLPKADQAQAQAEFDEREKFFAALKDLSDEEKRAKIADYMSKPENQDRMADRQTKRDERKTPEQRLAKYQKYAANKQQVINSKK